MLRLFLSGGKGTNFIKNFHLVPYSYNFSFPNPQRKMKDQNGVYLTGQTQELLTIPVNSMIHSMPRFMLIDLRDTTASRANMAQPHVCWPWKLAFILFPSGNMPSFIQETVDFSYSIIIYNIIQYLYTVILFFTKECVVYCKINTP